ncbi:hypothetical protein C8F01DRAFT_984862 [Mycena amicta]|nr:hypothetical protein C8F01DRAFT_984862 [Mycena amicta]
MDGVPPTDFVLQAHHVGILTLFILVFKEYDGKLPPPFLLHVLRLLLQQVVEASSPLLASDSTLMGASEFFQAILHIVIFALSRTPASNSTLVSSTLEGTPSHRANQHRRSVFGYFCRRCFVSFLKLSFNGVGKLQKEYEAWALGVPLAPHEFPMVKDDLHSDIHIYRTVSDKISWARPEPYARWQAEVTAGDEHAAVENLRKYFEQHFHEHNDSGFRQHALLNLVRMHYLRQEFTTARKLLSEAIGAARTSNDRVTLAHCITMLHRLPPPIERRRPALNEIEAHIHPLEILFDVSKLMDEENGQPLSASFEKIIQAIGLYDHWFDTQPIAPREDEQWAQHAVQSVVWSAAGCDRLAAIEEDLVIAFTGVGGTDNNRITVILNQAYREARQGHYEKSLSALLNPKVWRKLSIIEYGQWAQEVWHILVLWATRRGQDRAYREVLLPRRPPGEYKPRTYLLPAAGLKLSKIHDPLWEVIQMQHCDQAASAVDGLLTSLWQSEFLGRLNSYRTGIILLADIGLEFGMTKRSQRILQEIMPQIILEQDLEQRALACFTLARCILVAEEPQPEALEKALRYFLQAEEDYVAIAMHGAAMDVQYYLSIVYENLGRKAEGEEAARRHFATQNLRRELGNVDVYGEVLAAVGHVGAVIARR